MFTVKRLSEVKFLELASVRMYTVFMGSASLEGVKKHFQRSSRGHDSPLCNHV